MIHPAKYTRAMNNSLIFKEVSKTWRGASTPALDRLTLEVPAGSAFGLLGPNGAGKSTLINILLGLVRKDSGVVSAGGISLDSDPMALRRLCGLAPQTPGLYPTLTVRENLEVFARARGMTHAAARNAVDECMTATGIHSRADQRADELSGGLRQRLNVSLALLGNPPILILDEPTSGVDLQSRRLILDLLKEQKQRGVTLLYASHELDEVEELCDRLAIIAEGHCRFSGEIHEAGSTHAELARHYFELTGDLAA